jgi:hypothetical protein
MTRKSVSPASPAPTLAGLAVALAAAFFLVVVAAPDPADETDGATAHARDPAAHLTAEKRSAGDARRAAPYAAQSRADSVRPASI